MSVPEKKTILQKRSCQLMSGHVDISHVIFVYFPIYSNYITMQICKKLKSVVTISNDSNMETKLCTPQVLCQKLWN